MIRQSELVLWLTPRISVRDRAVQCQEHARKFASTALCVTQLHSFPCWCMLGTKPL